MPLPLNPEWGYYRRPESDEVVRLQAEPDKRERYAAKGFVYLGPANPPSIQIPAAERIAPPTPEEVIDLNPILEGLTSLERDIAALEQANADGHAAPGVPPVDVVP